MNQPKQQQREVEVAILAKDFADFRIVGTTSLLFNRMAKKAKGEIIYPSRKGKGRANRTGLKHDPIAEYRDSVDKTENEFQTKLLIPASYFKGAICNIALDMPGFTKAGVGRWVQVMGNFNHEFLPIWGTPRFLMYNVRQSDINKTPDIHTGCILAEWATVLKIQFIKPLLNLKQIADLVANAGIVCGIGDGRPQKGKLNYGTYRIANEDDDEFKKIVETQGYEAQTNGLAHPQPFDQNTEELWTWFKNEAKERGDTITL